MFDIPEKYKMDVKIPLKDFIPKDLKPELKRKVKSAVKEVRLLYQISGEDIPSVMNEEYRCQVIQIYDIQIQNIKDASMIANTYQNLIKSLCVLRIRDSVKEVYSFAIKRLSQTEENEIVVTESSMTEPYMTVLPDKKKDQLARVLSYKQLLNKTNKLNLYMEAYTKQYMIKNEKAYVNVEQIMRCPVWYDTKKVLYLYSVLKQIVLKKESVITVNNSAEKVKLNQEMKELLTILDEIEGWK